MLPSARVENRKDAIWGLQAPRSSFPVSLRTDLPGRSPPYQSTIQMHWIRYWGMNPWDFLEENLLILKQWLVLKQWKTKNRSLHTLYLAFPRKKITAYHDIQDSGSWHPGQGRDRSCLPWLEPLLDKAWFFEARMAENNRSSGEATGRTGRKYDPGRAKMDGKHNHGQLHLYLKAPSHMGLLA